MDWDSDFAAIWADFKLYYHVDLRRIHYLHWWDFMAMFGSLPKDAEIKRRISVRAVDLSTIKDAQTREEWRQRKELVTLDDDMESQSPLTAYV